MASFTRYKTFEELMSTGILPIPKCKVWGEEARKAFNKFWPHPIEKEDLQIYMNKQIIAKGDLSSASENEPIPLYIRWKIEVMYETSGKGVNSGDMVVSMIKDIAKQKNWTYQNTYLRIANDWND